MQFSVSRWIAALLVLVLAGCHACPPPPPPPPKATELLKKPAIDLSRGGAGFPLATSVVPKDAVTLKTALAEGYAKRLVHPELTRINIESGTKPGAVKLISIDLTGNTVRPEFVPKNPPKEAKSIGTLQADKVQYIADPLNYDTYSAGMELQADRAVLEMIPADDESLAMNLTDCHTGRVRFDLSVDSLKHSLAGGVNIKRSAAFMIDSIDLSLNSENTHELAVDAVVYSKVFFLPATFRLIGRVDVDGGFYVHFSNLIAKGSNPAGMLVAEIIQAKLDLINGKAAPLLKMPGDKIHVTDLAIRLGDVLTFDVGLAGTR